MDTGKVSAVSVVLFLLRPRFLRRALLVSGGEEERAASEEAAGREEAPTDTEAWRPVCGVLLLTLLLGCERGLSVEVVAEEEEAREEAEEAESVDETGSRPLMPLNFSTTLRERLRAARSWAETARRSSLASEGGEGGTEGCGVMVGDKSGKSAPKSASGDT